MYPLLRDRRRRPILPHRFVAPLRELLLAWSEHCYALADEHQDERWLVAARALHDAAEAVRRAL